MIDRVQRRLALALGASVLLHLWIAQTGEGVGARRSAAPAAAAITATLQVPAPPAAQSSHQPLVERKSDVTAEPFRTAATAAAPVARDPAPFTPVIRSSAEPAVALTPNDPTYYTARSLDVYPKALTALHLGLQASDGRVRATVLIDESGTVNDVRAIEAAAVEIEQAVRDVLLRTRFTPAAKDGRAVKAQLLLSFNE